MPASFISEFFSKSEKQTLDYGSNLGKKFYGQSVIIAFMGDLGAGKTTLIRGIAKGLKTKDAVCSPTFSYLNIYSAQNPIHHFDLYRLKNSDDFFAMGFDEFLYKKGVCLIEWAEKIETVLPKQSYLLTIYHQDVDQRHIILSQLT